MISRQIAVFAVRLLAIYCVVNALGSIANHALSIYIVLFVSSSTTPPEPAIRATLYALPFIFYLGFAVLLWMFSDVIGFFLIPEATTQKTDCASIITFPNALTLAICIVGLWITSQAVRPLSLCLRYFWMPAPSYDPDMYASALITGTFFLGLGVVLVLQAHKISRKLAVRYGVTPNEAALL